MSEELFWKIFLFIFLTTLIYLIFIRIAEKKKETFEDRDN